MTHGLRGFNGAVHRRLATLTVTMLVSSCWQLSSEVELRRIFDVCKRWAKSGSHEFVKKNMVRYMRPHGPFAHCSCKNTVRQPPVLASCIKIYYFFIRVSTYTAIAFYISSPPFLLSSRQRSSFENVTAAILFYAVSHLHEGTGKLRKTCTDTVCHLTESVPSLQSLKKWNLTQRFDMQAADRRPQIVSIIIALEDFSFYIKYSTVSKNKKIIVSRVRGSCW